MAQAHKISTAWCHIHIDPELPLKRSWLWIFKQSFTARCLNPCSVSTVFLLGWKEKYSGSESSEGHQKVLFDWFLLSWTWFFLHSSTALSFQLVDKQLIHPVWTVTLKLKLAVIIVFLGWVLQSSSITFRLFLQPSNCKSRCIEVS